jgi:hypothetical protein
MQLARGLLVVACTFQNSEAGTDEKKLIHRSTCCTHVHACLFDWPKVLQRTLLAVVFSYD